MRSFDRRTAEPAARGRPEENSPEGATIAKRRAPVLDSEAELRGITTQPAPRSDDVLRLQALGVEAIAERDELAPLGPIGRRHITGYLVITDPVRIQPCQDRLLAQHLAGVPAAVLPRCRCRRPS